MPRFAMAMTYSRPARAEQKTIVTQEPNIVWACASYLTDALRKFERVYHNLTFS
jgi:hypothetical protein